jgi:hypothetical protein
VRFLVANQKEVGSWPMTSQAHPGAKPMTNPVPITYIGERLGDPGTDESGATVGD